MARQAVLFPNTLIYCGIYIVSSKCKSPVWSQPLELTERFFRLTVYSNSVLTVFVDYFGAIICLLTVTYIVKVEFPAISQ